MTYDITSLEQLSSLYDATNPVSLRKETAHLTPEYRRWIEFSPFFALATSGLDGLDCSPRGDPAGHLVHIVDDHTVLIPDRRGNNRLDSLKNIIADPRVALLFLIPGINEALRINGRARLCVDPALLARFAMSSKLPASVIVVSIDRVYFQCARALARAQLWNASSQIEKSAVPTAGQMTRGAFADFDADSYDAALPERQKSTMY